MIISDAQVFTAGNGDRFGLITLKDSGQVVVFRNDEGVWRGCCEFNSQESTGIVPGQALPEIDDALRRRYGGPPHSCSSRS